MTDTHAQEPDATASPAAEPLVFHIRVTKAKQDLDVDFRSLPPEVQHYIVEQGLSKLLNGATSKWTAASEPDEAKRAANSYAEAQKKLDSLKAGKTGARASKSDAKVSAQVLTEARRLAKAVIKAQIKANKEKISDYKPKVITEAANAYLSAHAELLDQAKANIAQAEKLAEAASVDVAGIPKDPELIKKREAKNAAAKAETEAKNAGKPGGQASTLKAQTKGKSQGKPVPTRPVTQPQHA